MSKTIISPCVHMNGTSQEALVREYEAAWEALDKALDMLQAITVNGRDYYPYADIDGKGALYTAVDQHRERMAKVDDVKEELACLINNIARDVREQFITVGGDQ